MKKVVTALLTAGLLLSLVACGASSASKEEMLELAQEVTHPELYAAFKENSLRAEETYVGNVYLYSAYVSAVEEDYVEMGSIHAYLDREDLAQLNRAEKITVVGVLESAELVTDTMMVAGSTASTEALAAVMKDAYYVSNVFEITGRVDFGYRSLIELSGKTNKRIGDPDGWYFYLTDGAGEVYHLDEAIPVEHVKGTNITSVIFDDTMLIKGDEITVSARVISGYMRDGGSSHEAKTYLNDMVLVAADPEAAGRIEAETARLERLAEIERQLQGTWLSPDRKMIWAFEDGYVSYDQVRTDGKPNDTGRLPYTIGENDIVFRYSGSSFDTKIPFDFEDGVLALKGTTSINDGSKEYFYEKQ